MCVARHGSRFSVRRGPEWEFADITQRSRIGEENVGHKIGGEGGGNPALPIPLDPRLVGGGDGGGW